MKEEHKYVNADDVITSLYNAIDELSAADETVGQRLAARVNELLSEINRTKKMEKEEKDRIEAEKPYCGKEFIIAVHDPDGTLLPKPIEGYVFQKCLTTRLIPAKLGVECSEKDWNIDELDARLDGYISEERCQTKMARRVFLDEFMEFGRKAELKKWGLDRKCKFAGYILPVKLPTLEKLSKDINQVTEK